MHDITNISPLLLAAEIHNFIFSYKNSNNNYPTFMQYSLMVVQRKINPDHISPRPTIWQSKIESVEVENYLNNNHNIPKLYIVDDSKLILDQIAIESKNIYDIYQEANDLLTSMFFFFFFFWWILFNLINVFILFFVFYFFQKKHLKVMLKQHYLLFH